MPGGPSVRPMWPGHRYSAQRPSAAPLESTAIDRTCPFAGGAPLVAYAQLWRRPARLIDRIRGHPSRTRSLIKSEPRFDRISGPNNARLVSRAGHHRREENGERIKASNAIRTPALIPTTADHSIAPHTSYRRQTHGRVLSDSTLSRSSTKQHRFGCSGACRIREEKERGADACGVYERRGSSRGMRTRLRRRAARGRRGGGGGRSSGSGSMASATATAALLLCSGAALLRVRMMMDGCIVCRSMGRWHLVTYAHAYRYGSFNPTRGLTHLFTNKQQGSASAFVLRPPLAGRRGAFGALPLCAFLPGRHSSSLRRAAAAAAAEGRGWGGAGAVERGGVWVEYEAPCRGALVLPITTTIRGRGGGAGRRGGGDGGGRSTALWMARRETWTDIPTKDFYDAPATYMCVDRACRRCAHGWGDRRSVGRSIDPTQFIPRSLYPFPSPSHHHHHHHHHHTRTSPPPNQQRTLHSEAYGSKEVPEDFTVPFDATGAEGRWPERT